MSTSVATAVSSSLLDSLADYLQQSVADITAFLNGKNVKTDIVSFVAQAVSAANGTPVQMQTGAQITLNEVLSPFLPSGITPPSAWSSVIFSGLSLGANIQDKSLAFSGSVTCPLTVGGVQLEFVADLSLSSTVSGGTRQTGGGLSGTCKFASATFTAGYAFDPDSSSLTASWTPASGSIDLPHLCNAVKVRQPPHVETAGIIDKLALKKASFEIDLGDTTTFTLDAECGIGSAFVVVQCRDSEPVLVVGCQLAGPSGSISISELSQFDSKLSLSCLDLSLGAAVLLASTGSVAEFQVPNPDPSTITTWPFDPFPLNLTAGVTVGALLDLTDSGVTSSNTASHIKKTYPAAGDYLLLEAQLPSLDLTIELGTCQLFNSPFFFDLSLTIYADSVAVKFTGDCEIIDVPPSKTSTLNGLTLSASLVVTDVTVEGWLTLDYPTGFNPPLPYLKGLWIYELAGMLGLDFEKQEVTAGVMGKFSIGTQPQSTTAIDSNKSKLETLMPGAAGQSSNAPALEQNEFVIIPGLNDDLGVVPLPDIDLLILHLDQFSFTDFLTATLGDKAPSVSSPLLTGVQAADIQIYWCDELAPGAIRLPDGTAASAGFRFQGAFDFWSKLQGFANIDIMLAGADSETPGASSQLIGQFYLAPIRLGQYLTVSSDGNNAPPDNIVAAMKTAAFPYEDGTTAGTLPGA